MKRTAIVTILAALILSVTGTVTAKGQYLHLMGTTGTPRAAHTATMLGSQMVLLAGGMLEDGVTTAETLIYDHMRCVFRDGPPMTVPRASHTATALDDRRILMLGGYDGRRPVAAAELWEPLDNRFISLGDAPVSGGGHTATKLRDGRVLLWDYRGPRVGKPNIHSPVPAAKRDPHTGLSRSGTGARARSRWQCSELQVFPLAAQNCDIYDAQPDGGAGAGSPRKRSVGRRP